MHHFLSSAILSLLLPLTLAAPTAPTGPPPQQWQIPTLSTHFMGANSGIANGAWPDWAKFNSSLAFSLAYSPRSNSSSSSTVSCEANWVPGAYPTTWTPCSDGSKVQWKLADGAAFESARFTLDFMVDEGDETYAPPSHFLLCLFDRLTSLSLTAHGRSGRPARRFRSTLR